MNFSQLLSSFGNLFRWWVVVAPWEQGVRVRRGKYAQRLSPGLHLRIPGLDRFYVESTKLRTITTGVQTVATRDSHTVTLRCQIRFQVDDFEQVFMALHNAEDTVVDIALSEVARYVRTKRREWLTPCAIEEHVTDSLPSSAWGLTNLEVNVTDFAFVKVYRLIMYDERWSRGESMNNREAMEPPA